MGRWGGAEHGSAREWELEEHRRLDWASTQSSGREVLTWASGFQSRSSLAELLLACLGWGPLPGWYFRPVFISLSQSSALAQLPLPPSFLPLLIQVLWHGLRLPDPLSKSVELERQPVFPLQLQDGRMECWGSHTWHVRQWLLTHYTPGHSRWPHADKPSRYEKGSGDLEWAGENLLRSGSLERFREWGQALLAPLCCPAGLVWAWLWDVNGMKQGLGG